MSATNRATARSSAFDHGIAAFDAIHEAATLEQIKDISAAMAGFSAQASLIAAMSVLPGVSEDSPEQLRLRATYLMEWAALFIKTADTMNADATHYKDAEARYDA